MGGLFGGYFLSYRGSDYSLYLCECNCFNFIPAWILARTVMLRFFYLLLVFQKYFWLYVLKKMGVYKKTNPRFLRNFFEEAGGSFIKFGQLLALRVDVLPKEYSEEMFDLMDNVKPYSYDLVLATFLEELGVRPEELFKRFEKEPFAAASFGQVHGAKLKDGSVVVVKVMRPGIEDDVAVDFILLDFFATVVTFLYPFKALDWHEFANEFKKWTKKELDYRIEAENAERMYKNTRGVKSVAIPKTYHNLTTKRIIVQEYIEGFPLTRILRGLKDGRLTKEKLLKLGIDLEKIPNLLTQEVLREYFVYQFFHGDLHPGNIILKPGNIIGMVDFGIMGVAVSQNSASFIRGMKATADMDFEGAIYYMADFSGTELKQIVLSAFPANIDPSRVDEFIRILARHFASTASSIVNQSNASLKELKKDYSKVLIEIIKAGEHYKAKLPGEAAMFIRVISMLGILCKQLDPKYVITKETVRFFDNYPIEQFINKDLEAPVQRISRGRALEKLGSWLMLLAEKQPATYQVVKDYLSKYNLF